MIYYRTPLVHIVYDIIWYTSYIIVHLSSYRTRNTRSYCVFGPYSCLFLRRVHVHRPLAGGDSPFVKKTLLGSSPRLSRILLLVEHKMGVKPKVYHFPQLSSIVIIKLQTTVPNMKAYVYIRIIEELAIPQVYCAQSAY